MGVNFSMQMCRNQVNFWFWLKFVIGNLIETWNRINSSFLGISRTQVRIPSAGFTNFCHTLDLAIGTSGSVYGVLPMRDPSSVFLVSRRKSGMTSPDRTSRSTSIHRDFPAQRTNLGARHGSNRLLTQDPDAIVHMNESVHKFKNPTYSFDKE